jgi:uncharacterized repeat protein (TIGR03806 family)
MIHHITRIITLSTVITACALLAACGGGGSDLANSSSSSSSSSIDTLAPSIPQDPLATSTSATQVNVSWSASTDTGGAGLAGYRIYRSGATMPLATSTTTSYLDNTVVGNTAYSYRISAFDNAMPANESAQSTSVSITTPVQTVFGLDARPSNTTCLAPARQMSSTIATPRVFSNLTFSRPVLMLQAPNDSSRWYVVEQDGYIKVFNNAESAAASSEALDISSRVISPVDSNNSNDERGLLGMAFHPMFATNHYIYLFYSHTGSPLQSYLSRFTSNDNGATFDANSEQVLLKIDKPYDNHNGGNIVFGSDGYLYIGVGDGGGGDDPNNNAQNLKTLLGKMLRIDVNNGSPYGIPSDNPFTGGALCSSNGVGTANCPEIYAYGLRNPWRWSFDANNNDLWVGDVGQTAYEEIDRITKGGNYGWRCREAAHTNTNANQSSCPSSGMIDPVNEYDHSLGYAVTGGYVYRGSTLAGFGGKYIFGDYGSGKIWALTKNAQNGWDRSDIASTGTNISSFAQSNDKELFFLSIADGQIRSLQVGTTSASPMPTLLSQTGCVNSTQPTQPSSGLVPFTPRSPLWSDAATKSRWIGLPNNSTITVEADGDFSFPNGTVLMKNFSLNNQLIETRLFMRHPDGVWAGYSYEWNDTQTDATLVNVNGKTKTINAQSWIYPSQSQCMQCHSAGAGFSLGAEASQLNYSVLYSQTNRTANQMDTLANIGMLTINPPPFTPYPDPQGSDTLSNRARSYLHANCSGCHRPNGGAPSNMDLRYSTLLTQTNACDAIPQSGDLGLTNARIIAPGNATTSVLVSRMNRRAPDTNAMPPIGSNIVDATALTLITDWINSLASCN